MEYNGVVLSILVQCPIPVELSAHLLTFYLVAPFLAVTQEIHRSTYIASHVVGHDALESH